MHDTATGQGRGRGAMPTIEDQLAEIRGMLAQLLERQQDPAVSAPARESYSVEEAAALLGKRPYTVREWCRYGRIRATKRDQRRGKVELWGIAAAEIRRFRDEGLLPLDPGRNAGRAG